MMVQAHVWFDALLALEARRRISRALTDAGVETVPSDHAHRAVAFYVKLIEPVKSVIKQLSTSLPQRLIVVASATESVDDVDAWSVLGAGAADVFAWNHTDTTAREIVARFERWAEIDELLDSDRVAGTLVGHSAAMREALCDVVEAARFSDGNILLTGESGTGKELAARLIHDLDSRRSKGPFVTVDCTTIVPTLAGSEFFGHERGAFTGAVAARDGAFARADGGTLFLDEVAELPPALQAELLRVVQEGTYKRVGGDAWHKTRFRLISATHRDLSEEAAADRFRYDFFYRIASLRCHLPSMRERREDVPALAAHFLATIGEPVPALDPAVARHLARRDYAGNVRELKHLVDQIGRRHVGPGPITLGDLPPDERRPTPSGTGRAAGDLPAAIRGVLREGAGLREIRETATDVAVDAALEDAGGNVRRASERLGVTPRALQLRAARRDGRGRDGLVAVDDLPPASADGLER
jgi:DNA-binding NtrC family response regulator